MRLSNSMWLRFSLYRKRKAATFVQCKNCNRKVKSWYVAVLKLKPESIVLGHSPPRLDPVKKHLFDGTRFKRKSSQ